MIPKRPRCRQHHRTAVWSHNSPPSRGEHPAQPCRPVEPLAPLSRPSPQAAAACSHPLKNPQPKPSDLDDWRIRTNPNPNPDALPVYQYIEHGVSPADGMLHLEASRDKLPPLQQARRKCS